jgi:hypothetical protein
MYNIVPRNSIVRERIMRRLVMLMIVFDILVCASSSVCLSAPSEHKISEQVAVVTELPSPAVEITDWDIALQTDLPNNRLNIRAICSVKNKDSAPLDTLDFDLLGAEEYYGVEVEITKIAWLIGNQDTELKFKRFMEHVPKEPSQARTHDYPEVTRVSLSPSLMKGGECRLVFDYAITCVDIKKRRHYNLIWEPEEGRKETCLMTDFSWYPRLLPTGSTNQRDMEPPWRQRNFFARGPRSTWRVTLTHPAELEGLVIEGRQEKIQHVGDHIVSQWKAIIGSAPQLFIGPAERYEKKGNGANVVFLLPKGKYNPEFVDAVADQVLHAYPVYTDWFGALESNEIRIVANSGIPGGHGAFMGMWMPSWYVQLKKSDRMKSGKFFEHTPVHELAHSWWADSVSSYGRGTKFLRESLANFATWHLAREYYGLDIFKDNLDERIFDLGRGKKPLFNAKSDEDNFSYRKGPIVLDILRQEMGDDVFFQMLKEFAQRYKNSHATFIDFVSVCNEVSRRDWMPFFYQWCYARSCPSYHLEMFESKQGKEGWQTTVKIRNDGEGIVRCPLELHMEGTSREEVFWVQGGEVETFVYSTDKEVTNVLIDPKQTTYQADDKRDIAKIEAGEQTVEEKAAIEEFYRIKARIEQGESFEEVSTPLHALLSIMSACRKRDAEAFTRVYLSGDRIAKSDHGFDDYDLWLFGVDILRAPLPPTDLKDGDEWLIYITNPGSCGLDDGLLFVYGKGKWMMRWNVGTARGAHRWRRRTGK